jgi:hypothetical protein
MISFIHIRKTKWFSYVEPGLPGQMVRATYRGTDLSGIPDPIGDGVPNREYIVIRLFKADAILAPCPDFCSDGESPAISAKDKKIIAAYSKLVKTIKEIK